MGINEKESEELLSQIDRYLQALSLSSIYRLLLRVTPQLTSRTLEFLGS